MTIRVKNWGKFQHFKDRSPPWIKLYRDLLDDMEWHELDAEAAKALVSIWLIASEKEGELPDIKKLAFRMRMHVSTLESIIFQLSHWLERDDINVISERYQEDTDNQNCENSSDIGTISLTRSRETEGEREKEDMAKTGVADSSPSNPAGANGVQTSQPDYCPQSQILAIYSELLPMARQPRDWTAGRQALLRARWREAKNRQNLDWWRALFAYIAKSKFLTGQSNTPGRKPFELGLDWLLKAENFAKVREGAYHDAQDVEETA